LKNNNNISYQDLKSRFSFGPKSLPLLYISDPLKVDLIQVFVRYGTTPFLHLIQIKLVIKLFLSGIEGVCFFILILLPRLRTFEVKTFFLLCFLVNHNGVEPNEVYILSGPILRFDIKDTTFEFGHFRIISGHFIANYINIFQKT
jgi:hypothetical protein